MIGDLRKTFFHTFYYSIANLSTKLVGFILLPLYTTYLSPEKYGLLVIFEITSFILIDSLPLHLPTAMMRWSASTQSVDERKRIIFTAFLPLVIVSGLLYLLLPFSNFFSEILFDNTNHCIYFYYLIVISSIAIINQFSLALLRFLEKSKFFLFTNILRFLLVVALSFYFLSGKKMGIEGVLLSQLLGYILVFILTMPPTIKNLSLSFDKDIFREMLPFILPLIISSILLSLMSNIDKYIIKFLLGNAEVGIYTLGFRIASIINVVFIQSFQLGYLPFAFKKFNDSDAKRFYSKVLTYYTLVLTMTVLVISIFSYDILQLLAKNNSYLSASIVIPFILFSFVFKGISFVFAMGFHFSKKTKYNTLVAAIGLFLSVVSYLIMGKLFGIIGVAISNTIIFIILSIITYFYAQKFYPIKYEIKKILKMFVISLIVFLIGNSLSSEHSFLIIIKLFLLLSIPIILYKMNFLEEIEIMTIKNLLNKILVFFKVKS